MTEFSRKKLLGDQVLLITDFTSPDTVPEMKGSTPQYSGHEVKLKPRGKGRVEDQSDEKSCFVTKAIEIPNNRELKINSHIRPITK